MTIVPFGLSTYQDPPAQLGHQDADMLGKLLRVWEQKRPRNVLRSVYYDGKQPFKDFGIAVPDRLQEFDQTLEWPAKGVSALVDRSNLEGFVAPGMTDDPFDIEGILADNNCYAELPMAVQSSAIHACSFLTLSQGDVAGGEAAILILLAFWLTTSFMLRSLWRFSRLLFMRARFWRFVGLMLRRVSRRF